MAMRDYGVYVMVPGLSKREVKACEVVTYAWSEHQYSGYVRCNLCLRSFGEGDKLKQFPHCEHIFHVMCLKMWLCFEAKCPQCLKVYKPIDQPVGEPHRRSVEL